MQDFVWSLINDCIGDAYYVVGASYGTAEGLWRTGTKLVNFSLGKKHASPEVAHMGTVLPIDSRVSAAAAVPAPATPSTRPAPKPTDLPQQQTLQKLSVNNIKPEAEQQQAGMTSRAVLVTAPPATETEAITATAPPTAAAGMGGAGSAVLSSFAVEVSPSVSQSSTPSYAAGPAGFSMEAFVAAVPAVVAPLLAPVEELDREVASPLAAPGLALISESHMFVMEVEEEGLSDAGSLAAHPVDISTSMSLASSILSMDDNLPGPAITKEPLLSSVVEAEHEAVPTPTRSVAAADTVPAAAAANEAAALRGGSPPGRSAAAAAGGSQPSTPPSAAASRRLAEGEVSSGGPVLASGLKTHSSPLESAATRKPQIKGNGQNGGKKRKGKK